MGKPIGPWTRPLRVPRQRRRRAGDRAATPRRRLTPRRSLKPDDLIGQGPRWRCRRRSSGSLGHRAGGPDRELSRRGSETDPLTPGETPGRAAAPDPPPARSRNRAAPAGSSWTRPPTLLLGHSLRNGHPRFMGYITSSAARSGRWPTCSPRRSIPTSAAWELSPAASEIEAQTMRWIAELVAIPPIAAGCW